LKTLKKTIWTGRKEIGEEGGEEDSQGKKKVKQDKSHAMWGKGEIYEKEGNRRVLG